MVLTGIAEFARELICERTRARREVGKRRGVRFGRPAEMSIARRDLAVRFLAN
jgi:DNA invertase Pin-like site-specific DNA recombinase